MAEESFASQEATSPSDSSSPSVIHGEINPNQRLCSVLLNEFNYLLWSRAISLALGGRSKLGFVNGSSPSRGPSFTLYDAWHANDQVVMSWILNSMEPKLSELFSYSESSRVLWKSIKAMYGNQNNVACIFQLKKDLAELRQDNQSFVQHLESMKSMWNELDLYRPHTTDFATLLKRADEDKVFQLLASLGAKYEDLRSHLLMTPDLPSFNHVCVKMFKGRKLKEKLCILSQNLILRLGFSPAIINLLVKNPSLGRRQIGSVCTARKERKEELKALDENRTWSVVDLPKGKQAVF